MNTPNDAWVDPQGLYLWYREAANAITLPNLSIPDAEGIDRTATIEALPIGNGRMGGLILGGIPTERIVLNEDSLWTGDQNPSGEYETMGEYQAFANLFIRLAGEEAVSAYRRDLDLSTALAHVEYQACGVGYRREYFCSHHAQVMVIRLTANQAGAYTGNIALCDSHSGKSEADHHQITLSGSLKNGMEYEAQLRVLHEGGTLLGADGEIAFRGCSELILVLAMGTNYAMTPETKFRGVSPHQRLSDQLESAARSSYDVLKSAHIKNYQALFNRVSLELGSSSMEQRALPTNLRKRNAVSCCDPEMEVLLFQYGRYLLISCSREGGLPANLQGLWNDSNTPAWHCDYHANINVEMNYWPAEPTNLAECHTPFFDLIRSQAGHWRKATAAAEEFITRTGQMTSRGFAIRTSHGIHGDMGWKWDKTANAWYCLHLWEHYAFGGDEKYLRTVAYPVMKETCQFWEDHLKELPDGRLVVTNAWSPEHGPEEDGVSYSQEIVWDLFNNYVEACGVLGVDTGYRGKVVAMRDRLAKPGIGSWGQLLEWMEEKRDPENPELDTPADHHRHTSHLFAVYPGRQIGITGTPELAAAARKSLDARSPVGKVCEWALAWRTALYARLHAGENAHFMLRQLFSDRHTCPNLFGGFSPMQADGNFGITAGIAEMLLQSHEGELNLVPALPKSWRDGSVRGLRARGGFEVDETWRSGRLSAVTIRSKRDSLIRVRSSAHLVSLDLKAGQAATLDGDLKPERVRFEPLL
jgi:alpha-L-fucosidase 2